MPSSSARDQRRITFIKAFMADGDGWVDVTIANLSAHGMMVKCNLPPSVGSAVSIRRRGAGASGVVQWTSGRRFGLYSADPIDLDGFAAESAAEANQQSHAPAPQSVIDRLWHWRARA
jgi:hypothetical protein